ncbi:unnamed protein product [Closterium sp. NIES-54]
MASRGGLRRGDMSDEDLERQQAEFMAGRQPAAATVVRLNSADGDGQSADTVSGGRSVTAVQSARGGGRGSGSEEQQRRKQQERQQLQRRKQQRQQQQQREEEQRSMGLDGLQGGGGEGEYRPLTVLSGIREKGFGDAAARPSAPVVPLPMSALAFPVARHRAEGPVRAPGPAAVHAHPLAASSPLHDPSVLPPPAAAAASAVPLRPQQAVAGGRRAAGTQQEAEWNRGRMGVEGGLGRRGGEREGARVREEGGMGAVEGEAMGVDGGMVAVGGQVRGARVSDRERVAREGRIARAAAAGAGAGGAAAVVPGGSDTAAPVVGGGGGRGVGETKEQREIDEANRGVVNGMSAAQIAEAQAELMARLPPGALDMLRRRGRAKEERRRGVGAGQGSRSEGVSVGAGSGGAGEEKQQQQEEMQVDGGSGGDSGGASLHSSQQPLSHHAPASGPSVSHQHDRPAMWEQRVERIRSVRFAMDGRPVPADVAREAESALGRVMIHLSHAVSSSFYFPSSPPRSPSSIPPPADSPQGMAVRDLAVRHVAERDWLRTGAQPGRAGYTVREAVALSRSHVPAQAAAGLALLSALLSTATHAQTGRGERDGEGTMGGRDGEAGRGGMEEEEDWEAVWAYALSHEASTGPRAHPGHCRRARPRPARPLLRPQPPLLLALSGHLPAPRPSSADLPPPALAFHIPTPIARSPPPPHLCDTIPPHFFATTLPPFPHLALTPPCGRLTACVPVQRCASLPIQQSVWRGEAITATAPVHKPKAAASFLPAPLIASSPPSSALASAPSLLPAFARGHHWRRNVARSELLLPADADGDDGEEDEDEEEEGGGMEGMGLGGGGMEGAGEGDKRTVGSDANVACRDVCAGLIRMGILPRLAYLLQHHAHLHLPCLHVALCIAHHSPAAATALAHSLHLLPPPPTPSSSSAAPRSPLSAILAAPSSPELLAAASDIIKASTAGHWDGHAIRHSHGLLSALRVKASFYCLHCPSDASSVPHPFCCHAILPCLLLLTHSPLPLLHSPPTPLPDSSHTRPPHQACSAASPIIARHVASCDLVHLTLHHLLLLPLPRPPSSSALPPASLQAVLAVLSLWRVLARQGLTAHLFSDYSLFFARFLDPPFPAPTIVGGGKAEGEGVWGGPEVCVGREAVLVLEALCCALPRLRGVVPAGNGDGDGESIEAEREAGESIGWSVVVALLPMVLRWLQPCLVARLSAALRATLTHSHSHTHPHSHPFTEQHGQAREGTRADGMEVDGADGREGGGVGGAGMRGVSEEAAVVAAVLHCLATVVTRAVPTPPHAAAEPAAHWQQSGAQAGEGAPCVRPPFIDAITSALLQSGLLPCTSRPTPASSPHTPPAPLPPALPTFHLLAAAAHLPCGVGVASASCLHGMLRLVGCLLLHNHACPPFATHTSAAPSPPSMAPPPSSPSSAAAAAAGAAAALSACIPSFVPLLTSSARLLSTRAAGSPLSPAPHRSYSTARAGVGALVWREGSTERGGPAPGVGAGWGGRGAEGGEGWWGVEEVLSSQHIALVAALLALLHTHGCMQPEGRGVSGREGSVNGVRENEAGEKGLSARELVQVCFAVAGAAGPADAEPAAFILLHMLLSPHVLAFSPAVPPVPSSTGEQAQVETHGEGGEVVEGHGGSGSGAGVWLPCVRQLLEALWFTRHSTRPALPQVQGVSASGGKQGRRRGGVGGRLAAVEEREEEGEMEGVEQGGEVQQEGSGEGGEKRVRFAEVAGEGTAGGASGDISTTASSSCNSASGVESGAWAGSSSGSFLLQGACVTTQPLLLQWHAHTLPLPPAWLLIPLPAAAALAAAASATHSTAPSEAAAPAPLSPLHTLHALLAFLTTLETTPSTAPHMACLPVSLKLHHLSLLFLADPPLYLQPALIRPIACLQDAYALQLTSQHSLLDFPPHLFPPSVYESFLQTLADRFAAASFGHVLFARQLATLLHAHVASPIRLAAWRALDAASALHLLPPLTLCAGSPMGYLYASPDCQDAGGREAVGPGQGQAVGGAGGALLQACMQSLECGALDKFCSLLTPASSCAQAAHAPGATSQPDDPLLALMALSPHKAVPHYPLSLALAASLLVAFLFDHAPDSDCPTLVGVAASPQPDKHQPQAGEPLAQSQTAMWQRESVARRLARYAQRTPVARQLVAYLLTWQLPGWQDRWQGHGRGRSDGAAGGSEEGGGAQQEEQGRDMGRNEWVVGKAVVLRRMSLLHRALYARVGAAAEASKGAMEEGAAASGAGDAALSALQVEAMRLSAQAHLATPSTASLG